MGDRPGVYENSKHESREPKQIQKARNRETSNDLSAAGRAGVRSYHKNTPPPLPSLSATLDPYLSAHHISASLFHRQHGAAVKAARTQVLESIVGLFMIIAFMVLWR